MALPQTTHALRVTVRVHVGAFHRETDLSLPASTTLADALPEILELCQAPGISRPWRVTTAAGFALDMTAPLFRTPLEHGSVLILTPMEPVDAPIVRDSAEALVGVVGGRAGATGAAQLVSVLGVLGAVGLLSLVLPWSAACAGGAVLALVLVVWLRSAHVIAVGSLMLGAVAGGLVVEPDSPGDVPWALAAAVGAGLALAIVLSVLGSLPVRAGAALLVLGLGGVAAAGGLALRAWTAVPAAVLALCLLIVLVGPALATSWAGLRVPVLPTAGQDLAASDTDQPDVHDRALRAVHVADGLAIGLAVCGVPAALALGWEGSVFAQVTCLTFGGAVLLHGARHLSPIPAWSLCLVGSAALAGAMLTVVSESPHPGQIILTGVLATLAVTSVIWAPKVRFWEPTRMVWLERAEIVAIIAVVPLLVHMMGLFAMIRGLG